MRAETDDAALAELRDVELVDGHPVDLAAATADLGEHRVARLRALARTFDGSGPSARPPAGAEARRLAERVLRADKYQEPREPQPFRGALRWIADRLAPLGRPFRSLWDAAADFPGGQLILLAVIGALIGLAGAALATRTRSAAVALPHGGRRLVDPELDPEELEAQAEAAEAQGLLGAAVRLRYEAGLLRLARSDRLVLRAETTPLDAAAQVGSPAMDRLTATFVDVVYGDRPATAGDVADARQGWAEVLGARSRR
ncbi:MAG: DUF4129 domain-containing protein [Acidimicrobiales bacterium]